MAYGIQPVDVNNMFQGYNNALAVQGNKLGLQERQQQMEDASRKRNALSQYLPDAMQGDTEALTQLGSAGAFDEMSQIQDYLSKADAREQQKALQSSQYIASELYGIQNAPEEQRPALYQQALQRAHQAGMDVSTVPGQYDPQAADAMLNRAIGVINLFKRDNPSMGSTPAAIQEYQYYNSLDPQAQQEYLRVKRNPQMINLGDRYVQPGAPGQAPLQEYERGLPPEQRPGLKGEQTRATEEAKADVKKEGQRTQLASKLSAQQAKTQRLGQTIDQALQEVSYLTAGPGGSLLSNVPGTKARDLRATIDTIKANVGFDALQEMRDNSPTGGALGQVSEMENRLLQSLIANLEQSQSPEQLAENLAKVKREVAASWQRVRDAYEQDFGGAQQVDNQPAQETQVIDWNDLP